MWTSRDLVAVYTHACLQCMLRQRFYQLATGQPEAQAGANHQQALQSIRTMHTDHSATEAAEVY